MFLPLLSPFSSPLRFTDLLKGEDRGFGATSGSPGCIALSSGEDLQGETPPLSLSRSLGHDASYGRQDDLQANSEDAGGGRVGEE